MADNLGNPIEPPQGKGLFKNSLLNFLGQMLPLGVAAVAVPLIIRDMGLERYGLLSLSWILLGYFTFLDMGLGRATTNAVADLHSSGKREQIGLVVTFSLLLNFLVGIVGGALGWVITPWIVNTAFAVPEALRAEAVAMFSVLALSIPLITAAATLRGVLEGFQRFDYSNAVKSPALALMFLLPLMYKPFHLDLSQVVGLIVVSRFLAVLVFVWMVWKIDHKAFSIAVRVPGAMKQLLHYAGWVTVSNVFSPVLMYAERLLIAAMVPLGLIGFYTAPYEIISRLPMIPASVGTTLFPSFSSIPKDAGQAVVGRLFVRPTKFILFVVTPLAAVFIFFPTEILSVWLGKEFAIRSHDVLGTARRRVLLQLPRSCAVGSDARIGSARSEGKGRCRGSTDVRRSVVSSHFLLGHYGGRSGKGDIACAGCRGDVCSRQANYESGIAFIDSERPDGTSCSRAHLFLESDCCSICSQYRCFFVPSRFSWSPRVLCSSSSRSFLRPMNGDSSLCSGDTTS